MLVGLNIVFNMCDKLKKINKSHDQTLEYNTITSKITCFQAVLIQNDN
jgi:hypothetical protein